MRPVGFLFALLFLSPVWAETLYVTSPSADLKSSTSASASVIAQIPFGTPFTVKSKSGNWVQGSAQGKSGFVYKFKLSSKKPASSSSGSLLASLGGGKASAREGSTATSIRGLSASSQRYAGRANITPSHVAMVKHMEANRITSPEVEAFLKEGKLGEYAQ